MSKTGATILLLILAIAATLRTFYLFEIATLPEFNHPGLDAGYHDYWARGLAFGQWTPPEGQHDPELNRHPYFRPPGYPYFLALVYGLTGGHPAGIRVVQLLLGLVNVILAFLFVRRWGGLTAALVAAFISATYWTCIYYEGELLEPALLLTLTWCCFLTLGAWLRQPALPMAAWAGVTLGLFALCRPNALLFIPVAAAWLLIAARSTGLPGKKALLHALALGAAAALCIAPAAIRNWIVARDLVLISSNGGINLLMGQDAEAVANHASAETGAWNCFDYPRMIDQLSRETGRPLKASDASRHYTELAWERMLRNPRATLQLLQLKTLLFWGPREVSNNKIEELDRLHSRILRHLPIQFPWLVGTAACGLLLAFRRSRTEPQQTALLILLVLFAWVYFLSFLPFIAAGQYRMPVLPVLTVFASCFIAEVVRLLQNRQPARAIGWLAGATLLCAAFSLNPTGYQVQPAKWHLARAIATERGGDFAAAEVEYRETIRLAPGLDIAHLRLGALLAREERVKEAIPFFRTALALHPGDPEAAFNLGLALAISGNLKEAIPLLEMVVEQQPAHADAHQNLANAYQLSGQPEKALVHRRLAQELRDSDPP